MCRACGRRAAAALCHRHAAQVRRGQPLCQAAIIWLNEETLRHVIFNDPNYDLHSFNFDTDLPALQVAAAQVDADNPDLSGFPDSMAN